MEKLDLLKKHQDNLEEDTVIFCQKETKELADLLQKGNTNKNIKITRIPFYRLERLKKIEEEKLKHIHKAEKKEKKDLEKIGKGHDYRHVERRRYKKTKKQKELMQQNINKETQIQKDKDKEINMNIKENNKMKNLINKTEENEKEQKKAKFNNISLNSIENKNSNKVHFQNNINLTERNSANNKNNILSRNYSDYYHELKYAPSTIKFSKKELRMSKKQQKIQYPEYTLGHFLSKEEKNSFSKLAHRFNLKKKDIAEKKSNNIEINKNLNKKSEKILNSNNIKRPQIKKVNSEKKISNTLKEQNISNNNKKEKDNTVKKVPSSDNINKKLFENNQNEDVNNIIKEEIDKENEIDNEEYQKKHGNLKLLKKKHKRMNKYKKAILKFRLAKKKAFCDAVEKDNEQLFFSNTFNVDESINNVISNILNQNNNTDGITSNNNITNNNNDYSYNLSIIDENKLQDNIQENNQNKSQKNNEANLSNKYSPILSKIKIENNNQNNSTLNYYSFNDDYNNITINSNNNDIPSKLNYSENNNINANVLTNNYFSPKIQNDNYLNNNNIIPNNNYINNNQYININQNYYMNNNIYNYNYYPYPTFPLQYNNSMNDIYNVNNINNYNNTYKNNNSMNNSLPLPNTLFNPDIPTIKLKLKKEKQKEKKLNNYLEQLKAENTQISSLNIDSMNGKELTSLMKENKDLGKIDLSLINLLLPEEQANSFVKKYEGISKAKNSQIQTKAAQKPIREYVDQILDKNFEKTFSNFIEKLRDIYYKKKSVAPLKAKKRIVVGMREIEKSIRLKNILLLFVVPYIEKVEGMKNSMDERILDIFQNCRKNEVPIFFGLNKFKLGQIARKKISAISMLAIVNVEGMENELKNIIKLGNELRKNWYLENYEKKENFKDNKFIIQDNFEYFHNMYLVEELQNNKGIKIENK